MSDTSIVLNLKGVWFNKIAFGDKRIEYREIKPYWTKRLFREDGTIRYHRVIFRLGYRRIDIAGFITKIDVGKCEYEGFDGLYYRIHFKLDNDRIVSVCKAGDSFAKSILLSSSAPRDDYPNYDQWLNQKVFAENRTCLSCEGGVCILKRAEGYIKLCTVIALKHNTGIATTLFERALLIARTEKRQAIFTCHRNALAIRRIADKFGFVQQASSDKHHGELLYVRDPTL